MNKKSYFTISYSLSIFESALSVSISIFNFGDSIWIVTGPSFTMSTTIEAPNFPSTDEHFIHLHIYVISRLFKLRYNKCYNINNLLKQIINIFIF